MFSPAPLPVNEDQRLKALHAFNILDTPTEQLFNDAAHLAAQICGTPIAAVSLIDEYRQWFKAIVGLDVKETSRDISFCSHTILSPSVMVVPNTTNDIRFAENPLVAGDPHIRFYAGAPLLTSEGYALGSLCVIDTLPNDLTQQQITGLQALARTVTSHIELREHTERERRLIDEREQSEQRFEALFEHSASPNLFWDETGLIDCNTAAVKALHADNKEQLIGIHPKMFSPEFQPDGRLSQEKSVEIERLAHENGGHQFEWQHKALDGYLFIVDVILTSIVIGVKPVMLVVWHDIMGRKRAEQAIKDYSVALESQKRELELANNKLEEANTRLSALATIDGLTALANHRAFQQQLKHDFDRARRYNESLSLIMIDVDRFKQFNDSFGHPAGDHVLKQVAKVLKRHARSADLAARYGGEEFAVLLPHTDVEGAASVAERIRAAISNAAWTKRHITISVGIASAQPAMRDRAQLIAAADTALYEAKRSGRNQVCTAP